MVASLTSHGTTRKDKSIISYFDDGAKGCNTDIITFDGDKITRLEVFFGWDIKSQ